MTYNYEGGAALKYMRSCWNKNTTTAVTIFRGLMATLENFPVGKFNSTTWIGCEFSQCNFGAGDFKKGDFTDVTFVDCVMDACDFSDSNFKNCMFINCDITYCKFIGITSHSLLIVKSSAIGADFTDAIITDSKFAYSDLTSATFELCTLDGTKFYRSNLTSTHMLPDSNTAVKIVNCNITDIYTEEIVARTIDWLSNTYRPYNNTVSVTVKKVSLPNKTDKSYSNLELFPKSSSNFPNISSEWDTWNKDVANRDTNNWKRKTGTNIYGQPKQAYLVCSDLEELRRL